MALAVISDPFQLWAEIGEAASALLSAVGIVLVIFKMFLDSHKANKALKREKLEKLQLSYTAWTRGLRGKILAIHVRIGWYLSEGHLETEYDPIELKKDYPSIIHTLELLYFPNFPNFAAELSELAKQVMEIESWIYVLKPDLARFPTWAKDNEALNIKLDQLRQTRERFFVSESKKLA
jgi:hypothetical protein